MKKNHYDTLGVRRDDSQETIKATFRKLSMELHPDVGGVTACPERFKEISVAANILTNEKRRRVYDYHLRESGAMGRGLHKSGPYYNHPKGTGFRPGPAGVATTPLQIFVSNIMRPRTFVYGWCAAVVTAYTLSYLSGDPVIKRQDTTLGGPDLVKAWKNPETGFYEQPAPWDPAYRSLNPQLQDVPREWVVKRRR
ncbi:heat shock protein binding [Mayamaea pseudoterrestris]|nr:heat shock protein binding [Mayamaea pseudoterrestris]